MNVSRMRYVCMVAILAAFLTSARGEPATDDAARDADAKQVALAWFDALMSGQSAVATSLSATPFSFDRKQEVKSLAELKRLFDQIAQKKGKREVKPTAVKVEASATEKVDVAILIGKETILVSVRPGEASRVVGFSD